MTRLAPVLKQRFFDDSGAPLAGGKVYTYVAGSDTPRVTYSDAGGTQNTNPVILDAAGEATIFFGSALYKVVLKDANDVIQWTIDDINANLTTATDGLDGNTILYGTAAPGSGDGNDGDFYFRTSTNYFYGPKASGAWPAGVDLAGNATAAAASAAAAATSETNAANSASAASTSASAASTSASSASTSASTASTQATNAASSASTASTQATNSAASAVAAAASAAAALVSELAAAASAAAAALFDPALYALLGGRSSGQEIKGGTAASETLTLTSTAHATKGKVLIAGSTNLVADEVNARVGVGIAAPTYRLHLEAGADNYSHGMALSHALGGANSLWRLYPDLNGTFGIANPNQTTVMIQATHTGIVSLAGGGGSTGGAVNISANAGRTTDHTLTLKNLSSQTGDALRHYASDGSTVNSKIDAAGIATFKAAITPTSAISASAIDWALSNFHTKTLGANTTFTFSNAVSGQIITVRLTNTASNYTVTWPTIRWAGGAAPTMTVGVKSDIYTFVYDGSNYYGSFVQDMS